MAEGDQNADPGFMGRSKQDLIVAIRAGFEALTAALQALEYQGKIAAEKGGGWSVKDNVAHLAAWEEILLRFHLGGEPFESVVGLPGARYRVTSYDVLNDHLYRRDNSLTMSEAMSRLNAGHAAVMEALERLTDEELGQPRAWLDTPEGPSGALKQYVASNTYEHYAEHLATIKSLAESG